jgi:hypothetical protein
MTRTEWINAVTKTFMQYGLSESDAHNLADEEYDMTQNPLSKDPYKIALEEINQWDDNIYY